MSRTFHPPTRRLLPSRLPGTLLAFALLAVALLSACEGGGSDETNGDVHTDAAAPQGDTAIANPGWDVARDHDAAGKPLGDAAEAPDATVDATVDVSGDASADADDVADTPPPTCTPELAGTEHVCTVANVYGVCAGVARCGEDGEWGECSAATPEPDLCDGEDNDCDGVPDEGFHGLGAPCDSEDDDDLCANGTWQCAASGVTLDCMDDTPRAERCNGLDDDCDGETDEDFPQRGQACDGDDNDECALGVWECGPDGVVCRDEQPRFEACNGLDDDCDGEIDGHKEICQTDCGRGVRQCTGGEWGPCSSGESQLCTVYSDCSEAPLCATVCPGPPAEQCDGRDQDCDGATDEDFECVLGAEESESCGGCGVRTRTCLDGCRWSEFGACTGGGCSPGAVESVPCGNCGVSTRTCDDACQWGPWSDCTDEGVCAPGSEDSTSCGSCGTKTRSCAADCSWGTWSDCSGGGVCSPGAQQSEGCGNCGSRTRTCTDQCSWGSWGSCGGQGVCSPGATGDANCDPCSQQTCQANCQWSGCELKPGNECEWEQGTHWRCCGTHMWQFCLPPSFGDDGCKWSRDCSYTASSCG